MSGRRTSHATSGAGTARRLATIAALLVGLAAASAAALDEPASSAVARGEIRLPDAGCPAVSFTVRDGETLHVRDERSDTTFGFVLAVDPLDPTRSSWVPVEMADAGSVAGAQLAGAPRATQVGLVESFELSSRRVSGSTFRFELQVLDVGPDTIVGAAAIQAGGSDECCVTCDNWTVCGSCVEMWCGSCCGGEGASDIAPATGRRP